MSSGHVCGCNSLEMSSVRTRNLFAGFVMSASVVDVFFKVHFSSNITEEGGSICFLVPAFSCIAKKKIFVYSLLDFRVPALGVLSRNLIRCFFSYWVPPCRASSYRFARDASFRVRLLLAAIASRRNVCL